jgi:hypothetical protein
MLQPGRNSNIEEAKEQARLDRGRWYSAYAKCCYFREMLRKLTDKYGLPNRGKCLFLSSESPIATSTVNTYSSSEIFSIPDEN